MLKKNIEKQERKQKRKPTIPYTRSTPTLKEKKDRIKNKHKNKGEENV